ncbi:MAG TPA: hypothetical protein VFB25_12440 [Gaiellaceae bacterium]|nr:hypothetical protein [Gaiellaceae bacterium]
MLLAVKLVLTPSVVVLSTLIGRRFGRIASGWIVGLPLTSGPIAAFFAVQHGRLFAARAGVGSLGGAIAEVAFCIAYAATARRAGWRSAVLVASVAFAVAAAVLHALDVQPRAVEVVPLGACAAVALLAGLRLVPHVPPRLDAEQVLPSRWDIPARAVVATVFLLLLTGLATVLGPQLAGVLAVYPLYTVVLAIFAHRHEGEHGAVQVLRGLLFGLYSFVAFYVVLPIALRHLGIAPAFVVAYAASFAVQAASMLALLSRR